MLFFSFIAVGLGSALAQDGGGGGGGSSEHKSFVFGARFETMPTIEMRMSEGLAGSAQPAVVNGTFTTSRLGAAFTYRATPAVFVTAHGGVLLSPQITGTATSTVAGDISQVWNPDPAPYIGIEMGINLLPKSIFRITPRARWNRSYMGGTQLAVTNSIGPCTYDYSSNNSSTCYTIGQNTGGGVTRYNWIWNQFDLGMELAIDIGPDNAPFLSIGIEGLESFSVLSGDLTYTPPLVGSSNQEKMTYLNTKADNILFNLTSTLGMLKFGVQFKFVGDFAVYSHLGVMF